MRCTAYCTAHSYPLSDVQSAFQKSQEELPATLYKGGLHIPFKAGEIFCFPYGSLISWGLSKEEEQEFLTFLSPLQKDPLAVPVCDEFSYSYGEHARVFQDEITLTSKETTFDKLAVSHGLAQSVKLSSFEDRIGKTVRETQSIPESLAQKGKIPLSRREINRKIGALFMERSSINLHSDILGTPDFFWEYPEFEPLYQMTVNDLDLTQRTDILNHRLNLIHELFEILGNELNHRHSSFLEWVIIFLILSEVILTITLELFL